MERDSKTSSELNQTATQAGLPNLVKYTLFGILFGFYFPVVATLILSFEHGISFWEAQTQTGALIWIIDTAPFFLGLFAGIAGRKQDRVVEYKEKLENELYKSKHELEDVISLSKNEIYLIDGQSFKFIRINDRAKDNLGYTEDEMVSLRPWDLMSEYSESQFRVFLSKLDPHLNKSMSFSGSQRRKDGTFYPFEGYVQMSSLEGRSGYLITLVDQSESENLQRQVVHNSKLASIGELAAGVGHEINNPLTIADGNVARLKKEILNDDPDPMKIAKYFERYETASERIRNIVLGLRTFARSDEVEDKVFDLWEGVDQTVSLVREIYENEGIEINLLSLESEVLVTGNVGKIQQVLMNLISNARDAVMNSETKRIEIELSIEGAQAHLRVRDTGCGVPPEVGAKIFDAFYTTKDIGQGTGIGLALSASIIQEHNGTIDFESSSEGTCFVVVLPLRRSGDSDHKGHILKTKKEDLVGLRVEGNALVVDDEPEIRYFIREILEAIGLKVFEAENGIDALEKLGKHAVDFVFTDLTMPKMNGEKLIETLTKDRKTYPQKIYVITGGINTGFEKGSGKRLASLVDGYVRKPFGNEDIAQLFGASDGVRAAN